MKFPRFKPGDTQRKETESLKCQNKSKPSINLVFVWRRDTFCSSDKLSLLCKGSLFNFVPKIDFFEIMATDNNLKITNNNDAVLVLDIVWPLHSSFAIKSRIACDLWTTHFCYCHFRIRLFHRFAKSHSIEFPLFWATAKNNCQIYRLFAQDMVNLT